MKSSGAEFVPPNKSVSSSAHNGQAAAKPSLEDLMNDVLSMGSTSYPASAPKAPVPPRREQAQTTSVTLADPFGPDAAASKVAVPQDLIGALRLPANGEGIFNGLKAFQQSNRHKPLLELSSGNIYYIEYDPASNRVRVYMGNQGQYLAKARGAVDWSVFLVIDELFEFALEGKTSHILGIKRQDHVLSTKWRSAKDLLSAKAVTDKALLPVLHAIVFPDKGSGVSSCSLKLEPFTR